MKTKLLTLILFLTCAPHVQAQEDPNHTILKKLYTKIVQSVDLRRPKEIEKTGSQYFFVITQPGIFIDPALIGGDGKENAEQKRIFTEILDRVMTPSWVYAPIDETYYEYYKLILDSHEAKPPEPTEDVKKQVAAARSLLFSDATAATETAKYLQYKSRQKDYLTALGAGEAYLNLHPGASKIPASIAADIHNAETAWIAAGSKSDIEDAQETLALHDPNGFWGAARLTYKETLSGSSLHSYYPAIATWLDTKNQWPTISLKWSHSEASTYSKQTTASGGGSFSIGGLYQIGGNGNFDETKKVDQNKAENLEVEFEYLRVDFRRPWLTRRVFSDRRWRFRCGTDPAIKKLIVSSGPTKETGATYEYPAGMMPMIPTGFLIARNAKVSGNFKENFSDYYKRSISKTSSGGWGPFRVSGSASDTVTKTNVKEDTNATGFKVGHPQIIGFFVEVLPRSPEPLADLFEKCKGDQ